MARIRLSTTVDASLLKAARGIHSGPTDAALVDDALRALLARHRAHEIDAGYAAYDENPADQPDEWGDLAPCTTTIRGLASEVVLEPETDPTGLCCTGRGGGLLAVTTSP